MFGAKSVFISGLVYTTRVDNRNIDNRNIRNDSLYKDGLHLIDKGKAFLPDNFLVYLNNDIFLETHTHHPPKNFWVVILDKQLNFSNGSRTIFITKG